ncbi:MAG TPA: STAS domain-containing protein [Solirubrobacteraceae bacterium]|jgi:anti-anti-sigma factor
MLVEHENQHAGASPARATGSEARGGFLALPQLFSAVVHLDSERAVVILRGELDLMNVGALVDCLAGIVPAINEVALDFAELDFIECSGLYAIASAAKAATALGGSLSICSPRPQPQRLLDLVNFEQILVSRS